jgi:hypothetical protein
MPSGVARPWWSVSKTVSGLWVRRGFKSLPLRLGTGETVFPPSASLVLVSLGRLLGERPGVSAVTPPRVLGWLALLVLFSLAVPPPASAHVRTGRIAVDFRADVLRTPTGVTARVYESDLAVRVSAAEGRRVVVLGYLGEPFIRIGPAGAAVSKTSPTAGGAKAVVQGRSVVWHDARVRGLASGIERKRWAIPLIVDGHRTRLEGEVWRVRAPSAWPWIVLCAPFLVIAGLLVAVRRTRWTQAAAVAFGLAAAGGVVVTGAGFALNASTSEGKWLEAANELAFVLVGLLFVLRGKPDTRAIAGGALGLLALAVGLSDLAVFRHGVVLSVLSSNLVRTIVALTIAMGAAATCMGLVIFAAAVDAPVDEP